MQKELFPEYKEYNPNSPLFDNFQHQSTDYLKNEISVSRLNELFQTGKITADEHSFLMDQLYPYKPEIRISVFALASLITASINWILMLKFTSGDKVYQLLTGEGRTTAGSILAPLAVIFFIAAIFEIKHRENTKGFSIAVAGLTIAIALLTLIIPSKFLL